jgi:hypothetical protein
MTAGTGGDGQDGTLAALVLRRTVELAGIPAPTGAAPAATGLAVLADTIRHFREEQG